MTAKPTFRSATAASPPPLGKPAPALDPALVNRFLGGAENTQVTAPSTEERTSAPPHSVTEQRPVEIATNPTGTKKTTVFLDIPRWERLQQQVMLEKRLDSKRSAQKIFIDALDSYFRAHHAP